MRLERVCLTTVLLLVLSSGASSIQAAEPDPILGNLSNVTSVSKTGLTDEAIGRVFNFPVYDLVVEYFPESVERVTVGLRVYEKTGSLGLIFRPGTDQVLPFLIDMIDPAFRLTETTAPVMRAALVAIIPDDEFFEEMPEPIRSVGAEWHFIADTFFSNLMGFVLRVDPEGRVIEARFSLELEP